MNLIQGLKIGVIIPDRGDRPGLLKNCERMILSQSLMPTYICIVNFTPSDDKCDITKRYKYGYNKLRNKGLDLIAFIENDDWYSPDYLKFMAGKWLEFNKPDLLGTKETIYYHIKLKKWFKMYHNFRASAMNTLIRPDMDFEWCPDHEAFTDIFLWNKLENRKLFHAPELHSIGIKHGIGKCGAKCHTDKLNRFIFDDPNFDFLKSNIDKESFIFYSNIFHGTYQNTVQ
jgi:hypothetical protein